jgi:hypothetical protein
MSSTVAFASGTFEFHLSGRSVTGLQIQHLGAETVSMMMRLLQALHDE